MMNINNNNRLNTTTESFWNEEWKQIDTVEVSGRIYKPLSKYLISNYGRVKRKPNNADKYLFVTPKRLARYVIIPILCDDDKMHYPYLHRLLGMFFLDKPSEEHTIVAFQNYDLTDFRLENLAWMTKSAHSSHTVKGPAYQKAHAQKTTYKLNESRVALIKRIINDPNRKTRMKVIAKQFGISEMQLYRIKRGENWGHVKPLE